MLAASIETHLARAISSTEPSSRAAAQASGAVFIGIGTQ
jgi:hypothetical protein